MKSRFLATVSALALSCGAQAADLPVKAPIALADPPMNWTGWYAGLQGGFARDAGGFQDPDGLYTAGFAPRNFGTRHTGGILGGHVGYNWQNARFVYGFEADASGLWGNARTAALPAFPAQSPISFDVDWLATFRGRAGFTLDPATLVYVTGGVAFGHVNNSAALFSGSNILQGVISNDETRTGWVIGAGIERMFNARWTARAEVRYVDLGSGTATAFCPDATPCTGYRGEFSNQLLMGLVGVSLKF